jgi:hypothetical protein
MREIWDWLLGLPGTKNAGKDVALTAFMGQGGKRFILTHCLPKEVPFTHARLQGNLGPCQQEYEDLSVGVCFYW